SHDSYLFFLFTVPSTPAIYPLSLHDALPIYCRSPWRPRSTRSPGSWTRWRGTSRAIRPSNGRREAGKGKRERNPEARDARQQARSEEHTSELQSRFDLVCRLLLEKKK